MLPLLCSACIRNERLLKPPIAFCAGILKPKERKNTEINFHYIENLPSHYCDIWKSIESTILFTSFSLLDGRFIDALHADTKRLFFGGIDDIENAFLLRNENACRMFRHRLNSFGEKKIHEMDALQTRAHLCWNFVIYRRLRESLRIQRKVFNLLSNEEKQCRKKKRKFCEKRQPSAVVAADAAVDASHT